MAVESVPKVKSMKIESSVGYRVEYRDVSGIYRGEGENGE